MIRTIWLAIVCLALLSALTVGTAVRTHVGVAAAQISPDASTVGVADTEHALSKADRLEINYVRQEPPPQVVLQSIEPTVPVVIPPTPPVEGKIISRHWRDPHAFLPSPKDSRRSELRKTRKTVDRKRNQAMDRSKPSDPVKPCSRPGPFGDLLRAVNLSPACAS